jgi:DNA-binding PadR family transcriptional regulator
MNLKYVILGFLAQKPMHGYELKRTLSPAVPASQLVNDGILYPLLKRMERDGLIVGRVERAGKAPNRNVFKPTKEGRQVLADWLRSEQGEQDEVTYDFLLGHPFLAKCVFFDRLSEEEIRLKLKAQLESSAEKLAAFERIRAGMVQRGVGEYRIAVLDLGIAQQRAKLDWLKKTIRGAAAQPARKRAVRGAGPKKASKAA